jgi:hypothetical protein
MVFLYFCSEIKFCIIILFCVYHCEDCDPPLMQVIIIGTVL